MLFALVAAAVGPHWAVVALCALAATLAASAAIELDGERPPLSVAAWGTGIGVLGLLGVTASDGHWTKFGSAVGGVAVAGAMGVLLRQGAAAAGNASLAQGSWTLLPAGAALGWSGPVGAAVGAGVLGVLLLVALRAGRSSEGAPGRRTVVLGPGVAAALSAVLGVVAAIAAGASLA